MKSCPTCSRTFEDTFTFCLIDGAILNAPFDPGATNSPKAREISPPPTEVLSGGSQGLSPTQPAVPGDSQPTIVAPFVQEPQHRYAPPTVAPASSEVRSLPDIVRWMFILRGGIAILFGILLVLWGIAS